MAVQTSFSPDHRLYRRPTQGASADYAPYGKVASGPGSGR